MVGRTVSAPDNSGPGKASSAFHLVQFFTWDWMKKEFLKSGARGKDLGFGGIIIDDGWQTEDTERTYAYCGEWKPATSKIPDMASMVEKIHAMDMCCMLWYALPYIGERTEDFVRWKDCILRIDPPYPEWHVLDPRFPEVREHIIGTYEKALKEWNLDGVQTGFHGSFFQSLCSEESGLSWYGYPVHTGGSGYTPNDPGQTPESH